MIQVLSRASSIKSEGSFHLSKIDEINDLTLGVPHPNLIQAAQTYLAGVSAWTLALKRQRAIRSIIWVKHHAYFLKTICIVCLVFCPKVHFAQIILNPSFEGTPQANTPPPNWTPCHEFSTPDTQPGFWEVTKNASDGQTYIELVTRGNLGPYANKNEDVQSKLINPLLIGDELTFTIDLSFSENGGHFIDFGSTFLKYDTPAKLKIFGGQNACEKTELLWESPIVNHTEWRSYLVTLNPQKTEVNYLIFQADFTTGSPAFGNLLMDHIVECSFEVDWIPDTTICEHEPLVLDVTIPNGTYEWQDGSVHPIYTIQNSGTYRVTVTNGCSTESFEVVITTRNCLCDSATPIQTTSFDSTKCENIEIILDAKTPGGTYLWNTGASESNITVQEPGLYSVKVSNNCESKTFDYQIETMDCSCTISAPNVFTPNGDGINEEFEITGTPDIARYRLRVFDRSGQLVFETSKIGNFWDGTSNGKELPAGVYYFAVDLMCIQGHSILDNLFKGWVNIVR